MHLIGFIFTVGHSVAVLLSGVTVARGTLVRTSEGGQAMTAVLLINPVVTVSNRVARLGAVVITLDVGVDATHYLAVGLAPFVTVVFIRLVSTVRLVVTSPSVLKTGSVAALKLRGVTAGVVH